MAVSLCHQPRHVSRFSLPLCHQLRHVSCSSLPLPFCSQLTRLDENRARCQLALKSGKFYTSVSRVAIWGNHSTTQVGDKGVHD